MTLSITGHCAETGQLGLAMSSYDVNFVRVYSDSLQLTPYSLAVAAIGAIAVQANTREGFSVGVMDLLRQGLAAPEALERALAGEQEDIRERFQVGVVDAAGRAAAFTGERTLDWRGHLVGDGWAAAGNILAGEQVVEAMGRTFERCADRSLDERLLTALEAGIAAGGDSRGQRGAHFRIATGDSATELELRVHEHTEPVAEIRRLLAVYRQEGDFLSIALKAAGVFRASITEAELQQFGDLTTYDAVGQIRGLLAQRDVPPESLEVVGHLLSALSIRPDAAELRFGEVLKLLPP